VHSASTATARLLSEGKLEQLGQELQQAGDWNEAQAKMAKAVLEALHTRNAREQASAAVQDYLYEVSWRPTERPSLPKTWLPGSWLLLADRQGWANRLSRSLNQFGQECHLVDFEQGTDPHELARALEQLERGGRPIQRVVNFWSLDLPNEIDLVALHTMERASLTGTLRLVQWLSRRRSAVRLHLITRGANAVQAGDRLEPMQTPLWGFGKVIGLELPQIWGGLIDLPIEADGETVSIDGLVAELATNQEELVAFRSNRRYVARLTRIDQTTIEPVPRLHADASYLITGGLGELGIKTARWLAERGAGNLVLVGRRQPGEVVQANIEHLRAEFGCGVYIRSVDITKEDDVTHLIAAFGKDLPPLCGVVHAAGLVGKRLIADLSPAELREVMAPKVQGAWWLHEQTRQTALDFFVCFSSLTSVLGNVGQAHYAAANSFLDALMWHRRALGLAGTSLNFGPWAGGGMANEDSQRLLDLNGFKPLTAVQALTGWNAIHGKTQAVVALLDWAQLQKTNSVAGRRRSLLMELAPADEPVKKMAVTSLVGRLQNAPTGARRAILDGEVRTVIAQVLHLRPADIDSDMGFFDLGMDSLMAVEFRHLMEQIVGRSLPATLAMDQPRLNDLLDYLLSDVLALGAARSARPARAEARTQNESIAVIGLACRTPGAASAAEFWDLLHEGREAIGEIPAERWDIDAFYDSDPEKPGKIYTRYAALLESVAEFDASFFGITPREAVSMDPQQRLLLEVAWEALEEAAIAPHGLRRSRTGVYVGAGANEYGSLVTAAGADAIDTHFTTGNALNAIAGRLAFSLGLEGPAMVVDTACSSSLVALHQACQALRNGIAI
jgi:acyl transferase domain-containing protein/acyl carrier protein